MGVFTVADVLRIAAIDAGHELGVFDALVEPLTLAELAVCANVRPTHRFAALVDALVALGVLERIDEGRVAYSRVPDPSERPLVDGWGAIARVIRTDIPLAIDDPEIARRYQRHLVAASAPAARELAATLVPLARPDATPVHAVDIGAGAGAYSRALLEADSRLHVTVVDQADVVELARAELADFAARTRFVAGDARRIDLALAHDDVNRAVRDGSDHARGFDLAIVANVLHLHAPAVCAELCMVAARAVRVGGVVAIVDLRRGTLEGEMFALNMALYTEGGGVYSVEQIHAWLCEAGLELIPSDVPIDASASSALARRLESAPEMIVVLARRI